VSVRAQVINLLEDLKAEFGVSYLSSATISRRSSISPTAWR